MLFRDCLNGAQADAGTAFVGGKIMVVFQIDSAIKTIFRFNCQKAAVFYENVQSVPAFFRFGQRQTAGRHIFQNITDQTA